MNRSKIALYLSLIFIAGAIAGGAVGYKAAETDRSRPARNERDRNPEDFGQRIFNRMTERLVLTPEQVEKVKPVFWEGFKQVRAIQDRSVQEVRDAIRANHAEIAKLLTPEQKIELEKMDREHEEFMRKRGDKHRKDGQNEK